MLCNVVADNRQFFFAYKNSSAPFIVIVEGCLPIDAVNFFYQGLN